MSEKKEGNPLWKNKKKDDKELITGEEAKTEKEKKNEQKEYEEKMLNEKGFKNG